MSFRRFGLLNEDLLVIDNQETFPYRVAVLLLRIRGVGVDRQDGEHYKEGDSQDRQIHQLIYVAGNRLEHILEHFDLSEQEEQVDRIVVWGHK